jgi:trk system potassium uptake protein TrkA
MVHLLDLAEDRLEIIELEIAEGAPAAGRAVRDIEMPTGSLIISVLRSDGGFVPSPDTVVSAGDEVLVVLDPGLEDEITHHFIGDVAPE